MKNKNDKTCIGNNFEEVFHNLFASSITYNDVYSDDSENGWLKYEKGKYLFTNINTCNVRRMNLNQTIKIFKIEKDKLLFDVLMEDSDYQNNQSREFVLVKENNLWKISRAYYEDLCEIKYSIG